MRNPDLIHNLNFQTLCTRLYSAYRGARKHKRNTVDEFKFESNCEENILNLAEDIVSRTYKPSRGIAFVTAYPVIREIFAAPFRDRVIHHLIYDYTYPWWDNHFIYDSYSCRENKGTDMGIRRLYHFMQKTSRGFQDETYIAKFDIQGYFMSLPRRKLYERAIWGLDRQFPHDSFEYQTLRFLWEVIIFDDPIDGVRRRGNLSYWDLLPHSKSLFHQPPGRGIVIGNLTSQLLSNIYLDQLDHFITNSLNYKAYGRYVDDFFVILHHSQLNHFMQQDLPAIREFIAGLELTLHPHKTYIQNIERGIPFLGVKVYPYRVLPDKRLVAHFRKDIHLFTSGQGSSYEAIISYLGRFQHLDSQKLLSEIFAEVGWDYQFDHRTGPSSLYYTNPKLYLRQKL